MSAEIIQFIPRSNPTSDRAFWIGRKQEQLQQQANEIMNVALNCDTAPSEYVAPEDGDCA